MNKEDGWAENCTEIISAHFSKSRYLIREKIIACGVESEKSERALEVVSQLIWELGKYNRESSRVVSHVKIPKGFFFVALFIFSILFTDILPRTPAKATTPLPPPFPPSLFRVHNHRLLSNFLSCLLYITPTPPNLNWKLSVIIRLHGDPETAFLDFFEEEVLKVKELSVVMRERSVSVCVLRHLLEPYKGLKRGIRGFTNEGERAT